MTVSILPAPAAPEHERPVRTVSKLPEAFVVAGSVVAPLNLILAASLTVAGRVQGFKANDCDSVVADAAGEYRREMRRLAGMRTLEVWYERLDLEARILRGGQDTSRSRIVSRFEARILFECPARFGWRCHVGPVVQRRQFERQVSQDRDNLAELAGVRRGDEKLHRTAVVGGMLSWRPLRLGRGRRPEGRPPGWKKEGVFGPAG